MAVLQAHRGVSSEYPENTVSAFKASVEQGYAIIECDLKYTADGEIVVLHDRTLNRTGRQSNGEELPTPLEINDITLKEARTYDYGIWFSEKFKGEPIPTVYELLDFAVETQIPIKIDNCWEHFPENIREKLFGILDGYAEKIKLGFTCADPDNLRAVAERYPNCVLHYDGGDLSDERLCLVKQIAEGHHLTIWICYDNDMTKWFKGTKASPEACTRIKTYGEIGIWILSTREELEKAIALGADIIETTGHIKPWWL